MSDIHTRARPSFTTTRILRTLGLIVALMLALPTAASAGTGTNFVAFVDAERAPNSAGPVDVSVTTRFLVQSPPDAPTGTLSVTVEVYQGARDPALYADGGATALCRTASGANTAMLGSTNFDMAYGAAQIDDTRTVQVPGSVGPLTDGNALYAVTSYTDPTAGLIWSTCAYIPVQDAGPSFCDLHPEELQCGGGGGGGGGEPGWGGYSGPADGHSYSVLEMCDTSAQVTVISYAQPGFGISTPIRVNGQVEVIGAGGQFTFTVPQGGSRSVEWSTAAQTAWFPVDGNPNNSTSNEQNCATTTTVAETTTTTAAESTTTAESTTSVADTTTTLGSDVAGAGASDSTTTTSAAAGAGTLAVTGTETNYTVGFGIMLITTGGVLVGVRRRRLGEA